MIRILFVDDEPAVLRALKMVLARPAAASGWSLSFVESAEGALAELAKERFDILVTDLRMPGMDGAELLTRVRELYPQVACIVLSGQADDRLLGRARAVAREILSKPCPRDELCAVLRRVAAERGESPA